MFYGTLILAKKGPLAKVWLAAHWDKKLTKAHVFETDVETTVDNIISPGVKLALRTSGHLLLGVVRIYSRKQKYLIQDLGEACAKIKMAFRPGIIDLPSATRAEKSDSLALPEIFHNFSDSTAEMGVLQAQFTVNPSRVSEINIPEDMGLGWESTFGSGFDEGNFAADEQLQDFTDISIPSSNPSILRDNEVSADIQTNEVLGKDENESVVGPIKPRKDDSSIQANDFPQFADAVNDFGEPTDGVATEFMAFPLQEMSNETSAETTRLEPEKGQDLGKEADMEVEEEDREQPEAAPAADNGDPEPMAVDQPPEPAEEQQEAEAETTSAETPSVAAAAAEQRQETGFVLEPVNMTPIVVERNKRKRRVVVDNDKEFSGQQIKSQFEDYNDLLQPKCFPPPTKKAMMWREMAGCEQLYSNSTFPGLTKRLRGLIKGNYTTSLDFADFPLDTSFFEEERVEPITGIEPPQAAIDETENQKELEEALPAVEFPDNAPIPEEVPPVEESEFPKPDEHEAVAFESEPTKPDEPADVDFGEDAGPAAAAENAAPPSGVETDLEDARANTDPCDENLESTGEQMLNELSEEFEQRRWTKHTQQVVHILDRKLKKTDSMTFSSLITKCDRKLAASQFYTCLLLAKEGIIAVEQSEPYAEISIKKGPKYVGVV